MKKSLGILFFLNLADISLTKYLCQLGATELNPIIKHLMSISFSWAFLFKIAIGGIFVASAYYLHKKTTIVEPLVRYLNLLFMGLIFYQLYGIYLLRSSFHI